MQSDIERVARAVMPIIWKRECYNGAKYEFLDRYRIDGPESMGGLVEQYEAQAEKIARAVITALSAKPPTVAGSGDEVVEADRDPFAKDGQGFSDADCLAILMDGYAVQAERERLPSTADAYRRTASILRLTSANPARMEGVEVERDAERRVLICTGCGSVETIASIRARKPRAISCCPERKMRRAEPYDARMKAMEQALGQSGSALKSIVSFVEDQGWGRSSDVVERANRGLAAIRALKDKPAEGDRT